MDSYANLKCHFFEVDSSISVHIFFCKKKSNTKNISSNLKNLGIFLCRQGQGDVAYYTTETHKLQAQVVRVGQTCILNCKKKTKLY